MAPKVAVTDLSECTKELAIELPAEEVGEELQKIYAELARHRKVPGFRPGKVPLSVIKQRFRREAHGELARQLVPRLIEEGLRERQLKLAAEPQLSDLSLAEGQPLRFKATVEVFPRIEINNYTRLALTKKVRRVTERDVEQVLQQLREAHAVLLPVEDRGAEGGDVATLRVTAEEVKEEGEGQLLYVDNETTIELIKDRLHPDFYENIQGMRLGETKSFVTSYPEDFPSPSLAGKRIRYTVKLAELRMKELPELDDDFAREVGKGVETLSELREKIREGVQRRVEEEAEVELRQQALDRLVRDNRFELPPSLLESRSREKFQSLIQSLADSGVDLSAAQIDWKAMSERTAEEAARELRAALILEKIADLEQIEVSDAEVETEIARLAARSQKSPMELKSRLTKQGWVDSMKSEIRNRRALEFVVAHAEVKTGMIEVGGEEPRS